MNVWQASTAKAARVAFKTTAAINNIEISTKILLETQKYLAFMVLFQVNCYFSLKAYNVIDYLIIVVEVSNKYTCS